MKKKIFIGIGVLLVVVIGFAAYKMSAMRDLSPKGRASYNQDDLAIDVTYGRPSKRGRLIFGSAEKSALVPYNEYWRLGANEATEITFNKDVTFGDQPVKAGSYRMYSIPSEKSWTVVLNSELGQWGYSEADHKLDVVKTQITPVALTDSVEQFTIDFEKAEEGVLLNFKWDLTKVSVPVK